jgi:glucosyl-3-phosphoglycerate synthase
MSLFVPAAAANGPASCIDDWAEVRAMRAKGDQTVAVVIPARNEASTVGGIVHAVEFAYGGRLVDDLVVVDSASTDGTGEEAARAGARVVRADRPGKGEAMWHGVAAADADVVVFLDADLERFDPRFVPALAGPLLEEPRIAMVKGAYDRHADGAAGGGRVTELMARPLLAAFWPELGTIVQPLGGEYAVRRAVVEQVPFRTGYGVDIGLLLDVAEIAGADAVAQVDLGERFHSHSSLSALSRMAAEVLHTVTDRLIAQGRMAADATASTALLQPVRVDGRYRHSSHEIDVDERPPLKLGEPMGAVTELCG